MLDEVLFTSQPEQDQEDPNDLTRAPDYTPMYGTISNPGNNSACNDCHLSTGPRLPPVSQIRPNIDTYASNNQILNSLLNTSVQKQVNSSSQQQPQLGQLLPRPMSPMNQLNLAQTSFVPIHLTHPRYNAQSPTQPVNPISQQAYQHQQQQTHVTSSPVVQQSTATFQLHVQSTQSQLQQPGQPVNIGFQPQQAPSPANSHLHQHQPQQQMRYRLSQYIQQQPQQHHQQQQSLDYHQVSPQTSPALPFDEFGINSNELAQQPSYPSLPNNHQNYHQGINVRGPVPRIVYQPPQPIRNIGPRPPVYAVMNRTTRPRILGHSIPTSHANTPRSLTNLQQTQQMCPPTVLSSAPPRRTYQRVTNPPPQQTVEPPVRSPHDSCPNFDITTVPPPSPTTNTRPTNASPASPTLPKNNSAPVTAINSNSSQNAPVSVSSTTRPPSNASKQTEVVSNHVDTANKACQVKLATTMVHKCLSASVETSDGSCQTDFGEKQPEVRTYVDRASSPIFFPHPSVRTKSTPKRKRPEANDDDDDIEIQVV